MYEVRLGVMKLEDFGNRDLYYEGGDRGSDYEGF